MSTRSIIAIVLLGTLAIWYWGNDTALVTQRQNVLQSYGQVQNQLQRNADVLPNLAETVKGYAAHENKTLTAVIEARRQINNITKVDPNDLATNPELQKQLAGAIASTNQALLSVNVLREAYPDLKANTLFINLMSQIEGGQNRISVARRDNQRAIQTYNSTVLRFPSFIAASVRGYTEFPYFTAADGAQSTPQIKF